MDHIVEAESPLQRKHRFSSRVQITTTGGVSARGSRQSCDQFREIFLERGLLAHDTIPKTGCPVGYHPYRKTLRIARDIYIRGIDFRFSRRRPSDRLENPSPVRIVARIEFRSNPSLSQQQCFHSRIVPNNCDRDTSAQPRSSTGPTFFRG